MFSEVERGRANNMKELDDVKSKNSLILFLEIGEEMRQSNSNHHRQSSMLMGMME